MSPHHSQQTTARRSERTWTDRCTQTAPTHARPASAPALTRRDAATSHTGSSSGYLCRSPRWANANRSTLLAFACVKRQALLKESAMGITSLGRRLTTATLAASITVLVLTALRASPAHAVVVPTAGGVDSTTASS